MRAWRRAGCVLLGMLAATPVSATVIYTLTGLSGSFTYQADDFVTQTRRVYAGDLATCSASPGTCTSVDFRPGGGFAQDTLDLNAIYYAGQPYSYTASIHYVVQPGALRMLGTYSVGGGATLRVTSVPEPASWTMALAGLGLIGATLRRRRATSGPAAPESAGRARRGPAQMA